MNSVIILNNFTIDATNNCLSVWASSNYGIPEIGNSVFDIEYLETEEYGQIIEIQEKNGEYNITINVEKSIRLDRIRLDKDNRLYCGRPSKILKRISGKEQREDFLNNLNFISSEKVKKFVQDNLIIGANAKLSNNNDCQNISKFGGLPIGYNNFKFPKEDNGQSLLFVGQISIEELLTKTSIINPFPVNSGIIYIFATINKYYEWQYFGKFQIIYSELTNNLKEIELPSDLIEYGVFDNYEVTFNNSLSIPALESALTLSMNFEEEETIEYEFLVASLEFYKQDSSLAIIQHPVPVQSCITIAAAEMLDKKREKPEEDFYNFAYNNTENLNTIYNEWIQLLSFCPEYQFSNLSNFKGENQFNETEAELYLMIRKNDLLKFDFTNIQTVGQST
jgi:uncharacterized protein YwqG